MTHLERSAAIMRHEKLRDARPEWWVSNALTCPACGREKLRAIQGDPLYCLRCPNCGRSMKAKTAIRICGFSNPGAQVYIGPDLFTRENLHETWEIAAALGVSTDEMGRTPSMAAGAVVQQLTAARALADRMGEALENPSAELVSAMLCSQAKDDEGEFPILLDLLGFSGENKARTVAIAAIKALGQELTKAIKNAKL